MMPVLFFIAVCLHLNYSKSCLVKVTSVIKPDMAENVIVTVLKLEIPNMPISLSLTQNEVTSLT